MANDHYPVKFYKSSAVGKRSREKRHPPFGISLGIFTVRLPPTYNTVKGGGGGGGVNGRYSIGSYTIDRISRSILRIQRTG